MIHRHIIDGQNLLFVVKIQLTTCSRFTSFKVHLWTQCGLTDLFLCMKYPCEHTNILTTTTTTWPYILLTTNNYFMSDSSCYRHLLMLHQSLEPDKQQMPPKKLLLIHLIFHFFHISFSGEYKHRHRLVGSV